MNTTTFVLLLVCVMTAAHQGVRADTLEPLNCSKMAGLSEAIAERTPGLEKESFEQLYTEAECFSNAAARAGAQWLQTEQLLKSSFEAAQDGHWDDAFQSVGKARFEAETALQQADYEAHAWQRRVIRQKETGK
jgi:hypothetical protein